jgi:hypothetical protein
MIIIILLLFLLLSFAFHIYFLLQYVMKAQKKHLNRFINTAVSNILIAGSIMFLVVYKPSLIRNIDPALTLWLISGLVLVLSLGIKISLFRRMYRNMQDPKNYHLNFFGKKVLHPSAVSKMDMLAFFGTMPFFLMAGAYFVARLVNLIMFGRL